MLDDVNVIKQRDPERSYEAVENLPQTLAWHPEIANGEFEKREIRQIVVAGMGGSHLSADMVKTLIRDWLSVPYEVVMDYTLPGYVNQNTLVILISHSGNTEETLSCYSQAREKNAQLAAIASGGKLIERANNDSVVSIQVPAGAQPRMSVFYHTKALLKMLMHYDMMGSELYDEMTDSEHWLAMEIQSFHHDVPIYENYAKQLAVMTVGKIPVFYGGPETSALAYKWKISWNESAKNVAFCNTYPEFNHNEFIGWTSHPVEKPFAVFDLYSSFENERIHERMELSDRLLSGMRPKAHQIHLKGNSLLRQYLYGAVLADLTSIYGGILNGVAPAPVPLVEKLKGELSERDY